MDKQRKKLFEKICLTYEREIQKFIYTIARKDQFAMEEIWYGNTFSYKNYSFDALNSLGLR